jgi:hypothetical protein
MTDDLNKIARKPAVPASTAAEYWHRNGYNVCEIIVIRDGPAPDGTKYIDGRHQISVAIFESAEDAEQACAEHNRALIRAMPTPNLEDVYF